MLADDAPAMDAPAMLAAGMSNAAPAFRPQLTLGAQPSAAVLLLEITSRAEGSPTPEPPSGIVVPGATFLGSSSFVAGAATGGGGIVTSGLVMHLDAGNAASYPGTGTAWTDLTGNGNNGTLTNGPTYSAADGGSIVFDGSNDYVDCGNAASLQVSTYTLEIWFKATSANSGYRGLLVKQLAYGLFLLNNTLGSYDWPSTAFLSTGINAGDGVWRQAVLTMTAGGSRTIYVNAASIISGTGSVSNQTVPVTIGGEPGGLQYSQSNIAISRIYNRALSAAEITQNFDAQKARFGL
jgi:hypothetical protein